MVNGLDLQIAHKKIMRLRASCQAVFASKLALSVSCFPLMGKEHKGIRGVQKSPTSGPQERKNCL